MSKSTQHLVLPLLLALGCALAVGPAGAAPRIQAQPTVHWSVGWLSQLLGYLPIGPSKYGCQVDPDGTGCLKSGSSFDPDGHATRYGCELDPNGGCSTKP
jgi:hypothetical protein